MKDIFLAFAYINTGLWIITAILIFIGFMTYADYYTKNKDNIPVFLFCFAVCAILSFGNFIATKAMNPLEIAIQDTVLGFTCLSLFIYVCLFIMYLFFLGSKFRIYCGKKRGKL